MRTLQFGLIAMVCVAMNSEAAATRIEGARAQRLVSILASGNEGVFDSLDRLHGVNIREVRILSQATYKFDTDDSRYRIDRRQAWGKINGSGVKSGMHEATSLWDFLIDLGLAPELATEGPYLVLQQIDCRINPKVDIADARRIACVLTRTE